MRNQSIVFIIIVLLFFSCKYSDYYYLDIKNNNIASVKLTSYYLDVEKLNNSTLITKLDTISYYGQDTVPNQYIKSPYYYTIKYDISNIDSIGNYLPFSKDGYFNFNLNNNSLTISDSDGYPYIIDRPYIQTHRFVINFEREIISIKTENNKNKVNFSRKKNQVLITKSVNHKKELKKEIYVEILFKE